MISAIGKDNMRVLARFKSDSGVETGGLLDIPLSTNIEQLTSICNNILGKEELTPFLFFVNEKEVKTNLEAVLENALINQEEVVDIVYQQESVFKVRAVTRCTSSLPGHAEAVISVKFSPDSKQLASGSGDTTVRFWDLDTQTPLHTCQGHKNWVLCIAWSPDSTKLVSGCKNGVIHHWNPVTGKSVGKPMLGHKQWITALTWEPFHLNTECRNFASSSKDGDIRLWDAILCQCLKIFSSHTKSVSYLLWGGSGLLYSASQDRTIKVWRASDGVMCRSLEGHAHWVNTLSLNTEYVMRTYVSSLLDQNKTAVQEEAKLKYDSVIEGVGELLVSGSDDFTLFLWSPAKDKKPIARMTGHQQLINCVAFSPDSRLLASASFDKSIKLWNGRTGKFITTLKGHVQAVYMVAWSQDSRLLVSASADSTLKVWSMKTKKLLNDLPGHMDEVYAVDWSPDGEKVASGGKDKVLKIWQY